MASLSITDLIFAFHDAVPLIRGADLRLVPGWTGVVGANGAGKTTLLRLIAGELVPDAGAVRTVPPARAVLCPQEVGHVTEDVRALAEARDGTAGRLRGELGLRTAQLDRWDTLSPGERKRWQIAAALRQEPAVLLLDEPTNHLDVEARDRLLRALRRFRGIGLLVSHDRDLLDALTTHTLRLHRGELRLWSGPYGDARRDWLEEARQRRRAGERIQAERRKLKRRLADRRRQHQGARSKARTGKRMKGPRDHDARSMAAKGKAASGERRLGHEVGLLRAQLDRVEEAAQAVRFDKDVGRSLFIRYVPSRKEQLASHRAAELRAGDTVVLRDVDVVLCRGDRVRLAGPNGAGKTTLLRALVAGSSIPAERLLFLPQQLPAGAAEGLLHALATLPSEERGAVLGLVAALGVPPDALLSSARLSPGEARKLAIAHGLGTQVWAVILDEPTNHLDLPSIERLEEALAAYPGALLMVTHDDRLAARCTDQVWALRDGRVERHVRT